jgi:hypothetical protein
MLRTFASLTESEKQELDQIMVSNSKVLSTYEQIARMSIYRHLRIERVQGAGTVIERDAEEAQDIQIILSGKVRMLLYKHDAKSYLEMGQMVAGETCGDESIQRKFMNVMKIVQKDRKVYETLSEEVVVAKINKRDFIDAIF